MSERSKGPASQEVKADHHAVWLALKGAGIDIPKERVACAIQSGALKILLGAKDFKKSRLVDLHAVCQM